MKLYIVAITIVILAIAVGIAIFTIKRKNKSSSDNDSDSDSDEEEYSSVMTTLSNTSSVSIISSSTDISDNVLKSIENYISGSDAELTHEDAVFICQGIGICDNDKTELNNDELISLKDWLLDEKDNLLDLITPNFCKENFHRECFLTNGKTNHATASVWTDDRSDTCNNNQYINNDSCTKTIQGYVNIKQLDNGALEIKSNNIPAHNINFEQCKANHSPTIECNFSPNNGYAEGTEQTFNVPVPPSYLDSDGHDGKYNLDLSQTRDDAIMLDGVVVDIFSGGCYDPDDDFDGRSDNNGNKKVGCMGISATGIDVNDYYLLDPAFIPNQFAVDDNNAHTQSGGHYHYHANPSSNCKQFTEESDCQTGEDEYGNQACIWTDGVCNWNGVNENYSPSVIGFAADGHPIYELWQGATSCYKLKTQRDQLHTNAPIPNIDSVHPLGMYIQDYEWDSVGFNNGTCNLDEANGMIRNNHYGYYVTSNYPYIIRKFKDDPDPSFCKSGSEPNGTECG